MGYSCAAITGASSGIGRAIALRLASEGVPVALFARNREKLNNVAEEIRNLRFTFEDILKIDPAGVQLILKEINQEDLLLAMKTASDDLKELIYTNMSERASMMLKDDLDSMGPTKVTDVHEAQNKIIKVCKKLEEEGKIMVGGGGDEFV